MLVSFLDSIVVTLLYVGNPGMPSGRGYLENDNRLILSLPAVEDRGHTPNNIANLDALAGDWNANKLERFLLQ